MPLEFIDWPLYFPENSALIILLTLTSILADVFENACRAFSP